MKTTEQFILDAKEIHGDRYNYSKVVYINARTKIVIVCKTHDEFEQIPGKHLQGAGCRKCAYENKKYTNEEIIIEAKKIHGDRYDYSKVEYLGCETKVIIICNIHGEFLQQTNLHLMGMGCIKCGRIISSNLQKGNTEQFIKKSKKVHGNKYDYSKVEYVDCKTKVIINCKEHGEFLQTPAKHLTGGCKLCGIISQKNARSSNKEEFIEKAKEKHGDKYDYSKVKYINSLTNVIIICKEHGEFIQTAGNHLTNHGCKKCADIITANKNRFTKQEFIEKAKENHGDKYDYSKVEYLGYETKVIIICKEHGEFLQTPHNHLSGGCKQCANLIITNKNKSCKDEFIEKSKKVHGDNYDYSKVEYVNCKMKVIINCKIHGDFLQTVSDHLSGCGCQKCSKRKFSKVSISYLDFISKNYNIKIQHAENIGEYSIPNTRYKADGYCNETNTIYEFHGTIYHGDPRCCNPIDCNYFGKNYGELYQKTLDRQQEIKNLGYNLVVMWEYDWNKINNSIKILQKKFRSIH